MLATSCLSSINPDEEVMIASRDPQKVGGDVLSRLVPDSTGQLKLKENTRQNSGMTKQLAALLS